jgi:branched-chain amino acid aminotransferase
MTPTPKIWHNGQFIAWNDAKIHVLSHVVSYGSSVFEGIRCYETTNGPAIFRLPEHMRRMVDSAKIYRMEVPYSAELLSDAAVELVRENNLASCYIRPIVLRGYGTMGVLPGKNPVETYMACWEWGKYLGDEALSSGVDVCISSWNRIAPNTLPALSKAGGNYMNSQLIRWKPTSTAMPKASRWTSRVTSAKDPVRTSSLSGTGRCSPRRSAHRCCPASLVIPLSSWRRL